MPKPFIRIARTTVDSHRIGWELDCSHDVKAYLQSPFLWWETTSDIDLRTLPLGITNVPVIGTLITLAWGMGADLYVDELDSGFMRSLKAIRPIYAGFYPVLPIQRGELRVARAAKLPAPAASAERRVGLLYSGGLDAVTSLLDHENEITDLFTVWGIDVGTDQRDVWTNIVQPVLDTVRTPRAPRTHLIRTNLIEGLSQYWLNRDLGKHVDTGKWLSGVQHAPGFLSLVSPIAHAFGVTDVLIASAGHTARFKGRYASMPEIDNKIAWTGTECRHDNFHRSRQQKIQEILAPKLLESRADFPILCCWVPNTESGVVNCGTCGKCVRTVVGLTLAGIDPAACGFKTQHGMFDRIRDSFPVGPSEVTTGWKDFWIDIQENIPSDIEATPDIYGSREFFRWMRNVDIRGIPEERSNPLSVISPAHPLAFANRLGRSLPPGAQRRIKRGVAWPPVRKVLTRL